MSKVLIMDHPLVQHKVSLLRSKNTGTKEFKELVSEIATLLCYEATRDLPTEEIEVETPHRHRAHARFVRPQAGAGAPFCARAWAWWTACWPCCPPRRWATSACTATKRRSSRWSTTASCPPTSPSAR